MGLTKKRSQQLMKFLGRIKLRRGDALTNLVFEEAIDFMQARAITVHQIFCFDKFWSIVIPDGTDLEHVPRVLAGQACCYKFQSEVNDADPAALRAKVLRGVDFDDTNYATDTDASIRTIESKFSAGPCHFWTYRAFVPACRRWWERSWPSGRRLVRDSRHVSQGLSNPYRHRTKCTISNPSIHWVTSYPITFHNWWAAIAADW